MKRKSLVWLLLVILAGIAGGVWYFRSHSKNETQYQTATVARGELTQVVTATGQLNPVVNVQVGSQISGMIEKLLVDFNSAVTAGQVVAQIDASTYRANLHSTEGDLASARAALELAQLSERRAKELLAGKLVAQSDYDKSLADLHQAEAVVKIKEAARERTQVDLDRCTIYSPVDGIVISRNVDVGQTVAASLSAPTIFVIANDLTKMQIDSNVAEADIGGVMVGQAVEFTVDAFSERTFKGKVIQVRNAPITVQNVVTYDTVIEVSNPDLKLKPGMTANVSIVIAQREDVLKIPNAALRFRPPDAVTTNPPPRAAGGGKSGRPKGEHARSRTVYILDATGKPKPAEIKPGISDGIYTEVTDGLKDGDKIITSATTPSTGAPPAGTANPFGGGMPRRF